MCYYSREFDPKNIKFDRVCGTSTNGGTSWTNTRITTVSSSPVHDVDVGVAHTYMGDYDTLATDATGANIDNLETHDERKIIPWTCFSIEPGIYLPELGVRSEVDVFVDESSARVTGEMQEKIVLI